MAFRWKLRQRYFLQLCDSLRQGSRAQWKQEPTDQVNTKTSQNISNCKRDKWLLYLRLYCAFWPPVRLPMPQFVKKSPEKFLDLEIVTHVRPGCPPMLLFSPAPAIFTGLYRCMPCIYASMLFQAILKWFKSFLCFLPFLRPLDSYCCRAKSSSSVAIGDVNISPWKPQTAPVYHVHSTAMRRPQRTYTDSYQPVLTEGYVRTRFWIEHLKGSSANKSRSLGYSAWNAVKLWQHVTVSSYHLDILKHRFVLSTFVLGAMLNFTPAKHRVSRKLGCALQDMVWENANGSFGILTW